MPYTVSLCDASLLSQAAKHRAVTLFREAFEEKLGAPEQVAECFDAYLRVSASTIEDAAPEDLQACARFALAYFEATAEALERLADDAGGRFELRLT